MCSAKPWGNTGDPLIWYVDAIRVLHPRADALCQVEAYVPCYREMRGVLALADS